MKQILYILVLAIGLFSPLGAQVTGTWTNYSSYHNTTAVAEGNNYVFAVANGSLYSYGKEDKSIQTYSKLTGLSDTDITYIGFNENTNKLLIVYSNGNIDLLGKEGIDNLPFLMQNTSLPNKNVNDIYFFEDKAYLSTDFGVLLISLSKNEVVDTYRLNKITYSSVIEGDSIYAATAEGIYVASLKENLLDPGNWLRHKLTIPSEYSGIDETKIRQVCFFEENLCFIVESKGIFYERKDGSIRQFSDDLTITRMRNLNNKFVLVGPALSRFFIYDSLSGQGQVIINGTVNDVASSDSSGETYWIAGGDEGLKAAKKVNDKFELSVSDITIDSPKQNFAFFMTFANNKLLVAGGGRGTNRFQRPATLMVLEEGNWYNFKEKEVFSEPTRAKDTKDLTGVAVDPRDPTRYFVTSYGEGLFEIKDNEYVQQYTHENSTLQTIYPDSYPNSHHYIRLGGLAFDKKNNLWITNGSVDAPISVLRADGSWESFKYTAIKSGVLDKIMVSSQGYKWVNIIPRVNEGIFVFDDENKKEVFYGSFRDSQGNSLNAGSFCITEDKNGIIWIGTNNGPIRITNPSRIFEEKNLSVSRIVRTDEFGTAYYFLDGVRVNAIAVDGGNRKWLGTTNGAFLVNEDASETITHFTADKYPLLSDNIESIAINDQTGEVFFGTDKGIVSYMGGATRGSESYSDVYAFPNPVRPEFIDQVTITGLMADSNVKITDTNGNLIIQGKSLGGQYVWDCRKHNGGRVATGIYLVLSSTPNAKESVVCKIAVIK